MLSVLLLSCVAADQAINSLDGVAGWDRRGISIYESAWKQSLRCNRTTVALPLMANVTLTVCYDKFWPVLQSGWWEPETFAIFARYIDSRTTVIDFGTWIGPTLLYHALFSRKSYGIEGDPSAYAVLKANILLNAPNHEGIRRIELLPAVVATNHSVLEMSSFEAGNSCAGLGKIACGVATTHWSVGSFRLVDIFHHWHVQADSNVFLKIDVESYECTLLPSLYDWFSHLASGNRPTVFVAMHARTIEYCTDQQYAQIATLFRLYKRSRCVEAEIDVFSNEYSDEIMCKNDEILLTDKVADGYL